MAKAKKSVGKKKKSLPKPVSPKPGTSKDTSNISITPSTSTARETRGSKNASSLNVSKEKANVSKRKDNVPKKRKPRKVYMELYPGRTLTMNYKIWKDIRHLQMTTSNCIPKAPFARVIREVMQNVTDGKDMMIQSEALSALHEATEFYFTNLFEQSNLMAKHARRVTVGPSDMRMVVQIKGPSDPGHI